MPANQPVRRMRPLLGTFIEIQARGAQAAPAVEHAFARIDRVQQWLSFQAPDSELSRLNRCRLRQPQQVSALTWRLLSMSLWLYRQSEGLFNPAVAVELVKNRRLPDHGFDLSAGHNLEQMQLLPNNHVQLHAPLILSLDGIAKGYAIDCAIHALRQHGAEAASVNAGGDLRLFGSHATALWAQLPTGRLKLLGNLSNAAAASSQIGTTGSDRHPGWIWQTQTTQHPAVVTVVARTAWLADAMTKIAPFDQGRLATKLGASVFVNEDEE